MINEKKYTGQISEYTKNQCSAIRFAITSNNS